YLSFCKENIYATFFDIKFRCNAFETILFYLLFIFSGITKKHIREKVWTFMIERNIARKPFPIFNRIPNFEQDS
ncbi:hypothetical protein Avbf_06331, partial [Armadillidium vulgare]